MIYTLPTEHLSPTQLQALRSLESGDPIDVYSTSINGIIEIINLLIKDEQIAICCNPHTYRHLQNYKERHSQPEINQEVETLADTYNNVVANLKRKFDYCYNRDGSTLRHKYIDLLQSYDLSLSDKLQLDHRLEDSADILSYHTKELSPLLSSYKRTWERYIDIDPLHSKYYTDTIDDSLLLDLNLWIETVASIYTDMRNGLNEIVEEEKLRILSIKKQLSQHLVNYQHSQAETELNQMRKKMGFLLADLPKDAIGEFPKLVMYAVSNWESVTTKYLARHSRRFNSRNHQSVLIYEAMHELRAVLSEININGLLKVDISNNPLSYETQIIQVKGLLNQLHFCKYWLSDESDYIRWRRFYATLNPTDKTIIDILRTLDQSELQNQVKYLEIQKWKNLAWQGGIPTADDSLALFEAYKDLNASIDWSNIHLKSNIVSTANYQVLYDGVHYILSNQIATKERASITLVDKALDNIKPIITLDYFSQSKQANQLTEAILASTSEIKVYQTKALNIISCLDAIDTEELLRLFASAKINELKGESVADLLKGSILAEDKEKIILIYDDLLNVRKTEHYIWQRLVIQSLSSAGYKVITINIEDTLNHIDLSMHLSTYLSSDTTANANFAL